MISQAISLPFSFGTGQVSVTTDTAKMWQDRAYTAITTSFIERLMSPTYGTELLSAIWEPLDVATDIATKTINTAFLAWLRELRLDNVYVEQVVDQDLGTASLIITVRYKLPNNRTDELVIKTATFNRYGEKLQGSM